MNRSERRVRERMAKKNDDVMTTNGKRMQDEFRDLAKRAEEGIQKKLNHTLLPDSPPASEVLVVVCDGTSPIAPAGMRQHGPKILGVDLRKREAMFDLIEKIDPEAAARLRRPPPECGHVEVFVSTASGGETFCATCDFGLYPKHETPAPADIQ